MQHLNKTIWIYWHQGWDNAPEICKTCLASWESKNPGWTVQKLSRDTLDKYIDLPHDIPEIEHKNITFTSLSDIIRIFLLEKFGGIWVDSTLACKIPLDEWIHLYNEYDFLAFSKPAKDRLVSSWFLMAKQGSYIIKKWKEKTLHYWQNRSSSDEYFWFHYQFNELYSSDMKFKEIWDNTPVMSADPPHAIIPYTEIFSKQKSDTKINALHRLQSPVIKLTYKYNRDIGKNNTMLDYIIHTPFKTTKQKIFIAWYGSFLNNGTIGDYLSVRSLTHYLKKNNFDFDYASYKPFDGLEGNRIPLENVNPDQYDVLIFCCGPILKNHPVLPGLFEKFSSAYRIGIGVSLFPKDHFNYYNPFDYVIAREHGEKSYEDIAILSGGNVQKNKPAGGKITVGMVLRNEQAEYGIDNCKAEKANGYLRALAETLTGKRKNFFDKILFRFRKEEGDILEINNHLETSGLTPQEIETLYFRCNIILTTRFHGAMIALKNDIPFIAIDQIKAGGKVYDLVSKNGYPFVWRIDKVFSNTILKAALSLLRNEHAHTMQTIKLKTKAEANFSLKQLHAHLLSFQPRNLKDLLLED
jgi:hypothetical protein